LFIAVSYDNKREAKEKREESTPNIEDLAPTSRPHNFIIEIHEIKKIIILLVT
jgi:hypothetical protein